MRIAALFACLMITNSTTGALTVTSTTVAEIFNAVIQESTTRSASFTFEQSTQMMGMTISGSGEGVCQLPRSRTNLTFETPIGNIVVQTISDGKTLWQIEETPVGKKTVRHDLTRPAQNGESLLDPFMAFAGVDTRKFVDSIQESFDAQVMGVDKAAIPPVYILSLTPRAGGERPSLLFKIGVDDAFPREMSIFSPAGRPTTKMTVTDLTFDVNTDAISFTYLPGPDETVIDAADLIPPSVERPSYRSELEGQPAPDFKLTSLDGREVALSSFLGQHVVIDFWATWCAPCKKALPHIQALSEGTPGLVVLTVNAEPPSVARSFVEQYGYSFTTLVDTDRSVSAQYGVTAIPTTFIITPDGIVARQMVGYHNTDQLRQALTSTGLSI